LPSSHPPRKYLKNFFEIFVFSKFTKTHIQLDLKKVHTGTTFFEKVVSVRKSIQPSYILLFYPL